MDSQCGQVTEFSSERISRYLIILMRTQIFFLKSPVVMTVGFFSELLLFKGIGSTAQEKMLFFQMQIKISELQPG